MRRGRSAGVIAIVVGVAAAMTSGCGGGGPERAAAGGRVVRVVATTTQVADFARAVGGDRVSVYGVLKANVDPHDFEPSPADVDAIARADVVVQNGFGLEKWFERTIRSASPRGQVVDATAGVRPRVENGTPDPHAWHDPQNAKVMVGNIARALVRADPADAPRFEAAQQSYDGELDRLDAEIRAQLRSLPNKKVVTNHDALGYYLDHFGLEYVGAVIPSFDTQAELSARDIAAIVAKIRATGTRAVFSESSVPPKTARAIAGEAGVKVVDGDDALYGDTLGPPGSDGATYLAMERHNTREIVDNLR